MFVAVSGRWRVPEILPPPGIGTAKENQILCSCSTWIGLDGARNHVHSTLPQIGTIQQLVVRSGLPVAEYFSFHEWWCDGHRSGPTRLPLPVKPGDLVACELRVTGRTQVRFWMKNLDSDSEPVAGSLNAPELPARGTSSPRIPRKISGQTAQWITERPADPNTHNEITGQADERYVLANYDQVVFTNCIGTAARDALGADLEERDFAGGGVTLRNLVQIRENRAELLSNAELMGPQSVATSYRGPGVVQRPVREALHRG